MAEYVYMTPTTLGIKFEYYEASGGTMYIDDPRQATVYNSNPRGSYLSHLISMDEAMMYFIMNS